MQSSQNQNVGLDPLPATTRSRNDPPKMLPLWMRDASEFPRDWMTLDSSQIVSRTKIYTGDLTKWRTCQTLNTASILKGVIKKILMNLHNYTMHFTQRKVLHELGEELSVLVSLYIEMELKVWLERSREMSAENRAVMAQRERRVATMILHWMYTMLAEHAQRVDALLMLHVVHTKRGKSTVLDQIFRKILSEICEGPYNDVSYVRNMLAYKLWNERALMTDDDDACTLRMRITTNLTPLRTQFHRGLRDCLQRVSLSKPVADMVRLHMSSCNINLRKSCASFLRSRTLCYDELNFGEITLEETDGDDVDALMRMIEERRTKKPVVEECDLTDNEPVAFIDLTDDEPVAYVPAHAQTRPRDEVVNVFYDGKRTISMCFKESSDCCVDLHPNCIQDTLDKRKASEYSLSSNLREVQTDEVKMYNVVVNVTSFTSESNLYSTPSDVSKRLEFEETVPEFIQLKNPQTHISEIDAVCTEKNSSTLKSINVPTASELNKQLILHEHPTFNQMGTEPIQKKVKEKSLCASEQFPSDFHWNEPQSDFCKDILTSTNEIRKQSVNIEEETMSSEEQELDSDGLIIDIDRMINENEQPEEAKVASDEKLNTEISGANKTSSETSTKNIDEHSGEVPCQIGITCSEKSITELPEQLSIIDENESRIEGTFSEKQSTNFEKEISIQAEATCQENSVAQLPALNEDVLKTKTFLTEKDVEEQPANFNQEFEDVLVETEAAFDEKSVTQLPGQQLVPDEDVSKLETSSTKKHIEDQSTNLEGQPEADATCDDLSVAELQISDASIDDKKPLEEQSIKLSIQSNATCDEISFNKSLQKTESTLIEAKVSEDISTKVEERTQLQMDLPEIEAMSNEKPCEEMPLQADATCDHLSVAELQADLSKAAISDEKLCEEQSEANAICDETSVTELQMNSMETTINNKKPHSEELPFQTEVSCMAKFLDTETETTCTETQINEEQSTNVKEKFIQSFTEESQNITETQELFNKLVVNSEKHLAEDTQPLTEELQDAMESHEELVVNSEEHVEECAQPVTEKPKNITVTEELLNEELVTINKSDNIQGNMPTITESLSIKDQVLHEVNEEQFMTSKGQQSDLHEDVSKTKMDVTQLSDEESISSDEDFEEVEPLNVEEELVEERIQLTIMANRSKVGKVQLEETEDHEQYKTGVILNVNENKQQGDGEFLMNFSESPTENSLTVFEEVSDEKIVTEDDSYEINEIQPEVDNYKEIITETVEDFIIEAASSLLSDGNDLKVINEETILCDETTANYFESSERPTIVNEHFICGKEETMGIKTVPNEEIKPGTTEQFEQNEKIPNLETPRSPLTSDDLSHRTHSTQLQNVTPEAINVPAMEDVEINNMTLLVKEKSTDAQTEILVENQTNAESQMNSTQDILEQLNAEISSRKTSESIIDKNIEEVLVKEPTTKENSVIVEDSLSKEMLNEVSKPMPLLLSEDVKPSANYFESSERPTNIIERFICGEEETMGIKMVPKEEIKPGTIEQYEQNENIPNLETPKSPLTSDDLSHRNYSTQLQNVTPEAFNVSAMEDVEINNMTLLVKEESKDAQTETFVENQTNAESEIFSTQYILEQLNAEISSRETSESIINKNIEQVLVKEPTTKGDSVLVEDSLSKEILNEESKPMPLLLREDVNKTLPNESLIDVEKQPVLNAECTKMTLRSKSAANKILPKAIELSQEVESCLDNTQQTAPMDLSLNNFTNNFSNMRQLRQFYRQTMPEVKIAMEQNSVFLNRNLFKSRIIRSRQKFHDILIFIAKTNYGAGTKTFLDYIATIKQSQLNNKWKRTQKRVQFETSVNCNGLSKAELNAMSNPTKLLRKTKSELKIFSDHQQQVGDIPPIQDEIPSCKKLNANVRLSDKVNVFPKGKATKSKVKAPLEHQQNTGDLTPVQNETPPFAASKIFTTDVRKSDNCSTLAKQTEKETKTKDEKITKSQLKAQLDNEKNADVSKSNNNCQLKSDIKAKGKGGKSKVKIQVFPDHSEKLDNVKPLQSEIVSLNADVSVSKGQTKLKQKMDETPKESEIKPKGKTSKSKSLKRQLDLDDLTTVQDKTPSVSFTDVHTNANQRKLETKSKEKITETKTKALLKFQQELTEVKLPQNESPVIPLVALNSETSILNNYQIEAKQKLDETQIESETKLKGKKATKPKLKPALEHQVDLNNFTFVQGETAPNKLNTDVRMPAICQTNAKQTEVETKSKEEKTTKSQLKPLSEQQQKLENGKSLQDKTPIDNCQLKDDIKPKGKGVNSKKKMQVFPEHSEKLDTVKPLQSEISVTPIVSLNADASVSKDCQTKVKLKVGESLKESEIKTKGKTTKSKSSKRQLDLDDLTSIQDKSSTLNADVHINAKQPKLVTKPKEEITKTKIKPLAKFQQEVKLPQNESPVIPLVSLNSEMSMLNNSQIKANQKLDETRIESDTKLKGKKVTKSKLKELLEHQESLTNVRFVQGETPPNKLNTDVRMSTICQRNAKQTEVETKPKLKVPLENQEALDELTPAQDNTQPFVLLKKLDTDVSTLYNCHSSTKSAEVETKSKEKVTKSKSKIPSGHEVDVIPAQIETPMAPLNTSVRMSNCAANVKQKLETKPKRTGSKSKPKALSEHQQNLDDLTPVHDEVLIKPYVSCKKYDKHRTTVKQKVIDETESERELKEKINQSKSEHLKRNTSVQDEIPMKSFVSFKKLNDKHQAKQKGKLKLRGKINKQKLAIHQGNKNQKYHLRSQNNSYVEEVYRQEDNKKDLSWKSILPVSKRERKITVESESNLDVFTSHKKFQPRNVKAKRARSYPLGKGRVKKDQGTSGNVSLHSAYLFDPISDSDTDEHLKGNDPKPEVSRSITPELKRTEILDNIEEILLPIEDKITGCNEVNQQSIVTDTQSTESLVSNPSVKEGRPTVDDTILLNKEHNWNVLVNTVCKEASKTRNSPEKLDTRKDDDVCMFVDFKLDVPIKPTVSPPKLERTESFDINKKDEEILDDLYSILEDPIQNCSQITKSETPSKPPKKKPKIGFAVLNRLPKPMPNVKNSVTNAPQTNLFGNIRTTIPKKVTTASKSVKSEVAKVDVKNEVNPERRSRAEELFEKLLESDRVMPKTQKATNDIEKNANDKNDLKQEFDKHVIETKSSPPNESISLSPRFPINATVRIVSELTANSNVSSGKIFDEKPSVDEESGSNVKKLDEQPYGLQTPDSGVASDEDFAQKHKPCPQTTKPEQINATCHQPTKITRHTIIIKEETTVTTKLNVSIPLTKIGFNQMSQMACENSQVLTYLISNDVKDKVRKVTEVEEQIQTIRCEVKQHNAVDPTVNNPFETDRKAAETTQNDVECTQKEVVTEQKDVLPRADPERIYDTSNASYSIDTMYPFQEMKAATSVDNFDLFGFVDDNLSGNKMPFANLQPDPVQVAAETELQQQQQQHYPVQAGTSEDFCHLLDFEECNPLYSLRMDMVQPNRNAKHHEEIYQNVASEVQVVSEEPMEPINTYPHSSKVIVEPVNVPEEDNACLYKQYAVNRGPKRSHKIDKPHELKRLRYDHIEPAPISSIPQCDATDVSDSISSVPVTPKPVEKVWFENPKLAAQLRRAEEVAQRKLLKN